MTDHKTVADYLDIIGWTPAIMSRKSGIGVRAIQRWRSQRNETPGPVLEWLRLLADAHENFLPPVRNDDDRPF